MKTKNELEKIPEEFKADILKAIDILKEAGAEKIYIFGSLINDDYNESSDIDIGFKGDIDNYFKVLGKLIMKLEHDVDLMEFEEDREIVRYILKNKEYIEVA
ncbi:MAG: nucleotidyltransferase domain-containing protein [Candidatus Mcinerneyibacterium aminivorans]|uniref:Nucleotidyltransferase domain-containing protein n=1 Tax=Candidatus Mcinerneyibacterium aminivorans TaxID=2703815 RepID=A0A5D0MFR2_9BACT|nr:MAG: nucleotidyltransferase domain-containing protein [Candidatus Mcinerneyibacterium aminivorans]